jgi:hypothetical protein
MMALGQLTDRITPTGHPIVELVTEDGKKDWCLGNTVPEGQPSFGVFEYTPADQFCFWRNPTTLTTKGE